MTSPHPGQTELVPAGVRRFGYVLAIAFSFGILFIVNNLLEGEQLPFLTDDFEQLLPIINAFLFATIAINGVWILYDAAWFRSAGRITLNVLIIAVLALTYRVFPFDFSAYDFDWEALMRVLIVGVIVALTIATIVESVKLIGRFVNH
jgi:tryptophan-rich sensory protein